MPVNKRERPVITEKDLDRLKKTIKNNTKNHQDKVTQLKSKYLNRNKNRPL